MHLLFNLLAQINDRHLQGRGEPTLDVEYSSALTWIVTALVVTLILLIAFKTSRRNATDKP